MALYLGMQRELLVVDPDRPVEVNTRLTGKLVSSIAVDLHTPERVYCGTFNEGLWRSDDGGRSWQQASGIPSTHVQSIAVSPVQPDLVFAGTEPSALYRSDDGGETWRECSAMRELPSASTWSFPPRPETHHVRWITPDPAEVGQVLVAIEAGALVRTRDGGETWEDRRPDGPYDSHTVVIHPATPKRVLSAAGDGFFESPDSGETWLTPDDGLPWRYCWGLAIDSADPDIAVMSVAPSAGRGHGRRENAQSRIYRRQGDEPWKRVTDGLPDEHGMTLSVIAADPARSGVFYALNNTGLYRSTDSGRRWERLDVPWQDNYLQHRPNALAIAP